MPMSMGMAMSVHGLYLWLCRLSLAPKITMCIVLLSYALRTKIIYIMLKINVLDSTKYSQRFTKEFVNTYLVLRRGASVAYKIITVKQRTSNMAAWAREDSQ